MFTGRRRAVNKRKIDKIKKIKAILNRMIVNKGKNHDHGKNH